MFLASRHACTLSRHFSLEGTIFATAPAFALTIMRRPFSAAFVPPLPTCTAGGLWHLRVTPAADRDCAMILRNCCSECAKIAAMSFIIRSASKPQLTRTREAFSGKGEQFRVLVRMNI